MVDRTFYSRYIYNAYSSLDDLDTSEESENDGNDGPRHYDSRPQPPVPVPIPLWAETDDADQVQMPKVDAELTDARSVTFSEEDNESAASEEGEEHDLPQVKLVSISGLDGQPTWLRDLVLPRHVILVEFSFNAYRLAEEAGARSEVHTAHAELVELIADCAGDASPYEPQVLIFLAHDIGGMVLKQALVKIYESPRFAEAAATISCIIFFGTPHRCSFEFPWVSTLRTLFCTQYSGSLGPWLSKTIYCLVDDFESLTSQFDSLSRRSSFKIMNFYQETPPSGEYEVLVPESVATLYLDRTVNIGIKASHNSLTDFSRPSRQNLLFALIKDACASANHEYKEFLSLMARTGAGVEVRHKTNPFYRHLSGWILSSDTMNVWIGADPGAGSRPITGLTAEMESERGNHPQRSDLTDISARNRTPTRSFQSVQRTIQVLEINGSSHGTSILASSLVATIRSQRKEKTDIFISLAHPSSAAQSLTKVQLMSSLCSQLLSSRARLFNDVRHLVKDIKVAFDTINIAWRNATMWRLLKLLLQNENDFSGGIFIIIHQPCNEMLASPFRELIEDLSSWAYSTDVSCKILVVREACPNASPSGEHLTLSIRDISRTNEIAYAELWGDLEGERKKLCLQKSRLSRLNKNVLEPSKALLMDLVTARLWLSMTDQYPCLALKMDSGPLLTASAVDWAHLILDMIPKVAHQWVKSSLIWVTSAARLLSCSELVATMPGCPENMDGGYVQMAFEEFQRLVCGLVEADGSTVYVASPEIAAQLEAIIDRNQHTPNREGNSRLAENETESANESENKVSLSEIASHAVERHPHLVIARRCVEYLRANYEALSRVSWSSSSNSDVREMVEDPTLMKGSNKEGLPGGVPSLSYAAEYWLVHVQTWLRDVQKSKSMSSEASAIDQSSVNFIAESLRNEDFVRYWMKIRQTGADSTSDVDLTRPRPYHVSDLDSQLGLNLSDPDDLSKWMAVVQAMHSTCDIEDEEIENSRSLIVRALCECERDKCLERLVDDGASDYGPILSAAFQLGTDSALSHVASSYPDYVDQNCSFVIENAIRLRNSNLLHRVLEDRAITSPSEGTLPIFHLIAEFGSAVPDDVLCGKLQSHISYISDDKRSALHVAAIHGHYMLVPVLLEHGADVNLRDNSGATPLFYAAKCGHYTIVSQLLEAKANVWIARKNKQTPLHIASANGFQDIVKILLHRGAARTAKDRHSNTPLHLALERYHAEVALVLLEGATGSPEVGPSSSVDVDLKNSAELTPLMLAAKGNLINVITILLDRGADPNIPSKNGKTSLHLSAEACSQESFDRLIDTEHIDINICDENGNTPLHLASSSGSISMIGKLLSKRADSNARNKDGVSPLEVASERRWSEAVRALTPACSLSTRTAAFLTAAAARDVDSVSLLLDAGVDIDAKTSSGNTALHHSAYNSDDKIVQVLLTRRARLDLRDREERTALMDAVSQNAEECVKMLVDAGANVDAQDKDGLTALVEAAQRDYPRCVEILLKANPALHGPGDHQDKHKAFLEIALAQFKTNVFRLVVEHIGCRRDYSGDWDDALLMFLRGDDPDLEKIQVLLDNGFDGSREIGPRGTILHYAVLWDNLNLVKLLTEPGRATNLNQINEDYGTPLQIAAQRAMSHGPDVVDLLLKRGANALIGSGEYGSPLHAAVRMSEHWENDRYMRIAKLLLEHDSETLHRIAGKFPTVLQAAVQGGTTDMLEMLVQYKPKFDIVIGAWGTPLHLVARRGYRSDRNILLRAGYPHLTRSTVDIGGRLPLHQAVIDGNVDNVSAFARKGSSSRRRENIGEGESSTAESEGLNHKGPLTTQLDYQGRHALHFCAAGGNVEIAQWILDQHPETLNDGDVDGWNPLHWACRQEDSTIISFLVQDMKADKNARTNRGWRPIDVAVYHGGSLTDIQEIKDLLTPDDSADAARELENYPADEVEKLPAGTGEKARSATYDQYGCDSCYCIIYGPRYQCESCFDYDMCFKCFRNVRRAHYKGHLFTKFGAGAENKGLVNPWRDEEDGE